MENRSPHDVEDYQKKDFGNPQEKIDQVHVIDVLISQFFQRYFDGCGTSPVSLPCFNYWTAMLKQPWRTCKAPGPKLASEQHARTCFDQCMLKSVARRVC